MDLGGGDQFWEQLDKDDLMWEFSPSWTSSDGTIPPQKKVDSTQVAEVFGYCGQSSSNTMALVRKLAPEYDCSDVKDKILSAGMEARVRKILDSMLDRPIIDFLVRYFVTKVNWFAITVDFVCSFFQPYAYYKR